MAASTSSVIRSCQTNWPLRSSDSGVVAGCCPAHPAAMIPTARAAMANTILRGFMEGSFRWGGDSRRDSVTILRSIVGELHVDAEIVLPQRRDDLLERVTVLARNTHLL